MGYVLPDPDKVSQLTTSEQVELLNNLFEKHEAVHSLLIPVLFSNDKTYNNFDELIECSREVLLKLDPKDELTQGIIAAHPRLGVPAELSSHSSSEQKSIYSDSEADKVIKQFIELNQKYEDQFPGLRYVMFVNGRSREEIFKDFGRRFQRNEYNSEVNEALNAMCDIAHSRVQKLLKASSL